VRCWCSQQTVANAQVCLWYPRSVNSPGLAYVFWKGDRRRRVYCYKKTLPMHRWLCSWSCSCISFQLCAEAVHHLSVASLYRHIQFFKLLQFSGHNRIVVFVIKDYDFTVLIRSVDKDFTVLKPTLCTGKLCLVILATLICFVKAFHEKLNFPLTKIMFVAVMYCKCSDTCIASA